jgi:hypothetical protein
MDPGEKFNPSGVPYPSQTAPGDPFSDRAPRPQGPYDAPSYSSQAGAYASNVSLASDFAPGRSYVPPEDDEEKLPLTHGEAAYPGGYYPPPG